MVKNVKQILKLLSTTIILTSLSASLVMASPDPTNDTTKKIKLTTSATDNIDSPSNLHFAWYYNKPVGASFEKVALTKNTDSTDTKYYKSAFVKGSAGTSTIVTKDKYGNGVYIVECVDSNGNVSTETIELLAWDTTGPSSITYQVSPDNDTPSSHKSIRILAVDTGDDVTGLADKPYAIYGPVDSSFYTSNISSLTNSQVASFISSKRSSEPTKMSAWTDSTLTVDKEGYYVLFVKDTAGNIAHREAQIKKIDITSPEISGLSVDTTDGSTITSYNNELFNEENAPAYIKISANVTDNCTSADELKYTWYKDGYQIATGTGLSYLTISPKTSAALGGIIGTDVVSALPASGTYFGAGDGSNGATFNANASYKVIIEDECGNKSTSETLMLKVFDFTNPTMDAPTIDEAEAVKSNTIRVSNLNDNIALDSKPLSYHKRGETGSRTTNVIYTVTENGIYDIDLYDAAGNKITKSVTVNNLDSNAPVINGYVFSNNGGSVRIHVDATDRNTANDDTTDRLQYCLASSSAALDSSSYWQDSSVIDAYNGGDIASGTYWLGVKDRAGNLIFQSISVNKDYICGTLNSMNEDNLKSYITQSPEENVWTNDNVELTVNLPSIIETPQYQFNSLGYQDSNKKSFESNGTVTVYVKDKYGNVYNSSVYDITNIDTDLPDIDASPNASENVVTVDVSDALSGLQRVTATAPGSIEETIHDYSASDIKSGRVEYAVPMNGSFVFKVYDKAGNVNSCTILISNAKTDNSDLSDEMVAGRIIKTPASWTNGDVCIKLALNSTAGLAAEPYSWSTIDHYGTDNEITVTENGTYDVTVQDMYGNVFSSGDIVVSNIDKVAPTLSPVINNNKVTFTAIDALSNMQKITIVGGPIESETTIKDAAGNLFKDTLVVTWTVPQTDTVYTARAYDNAGNCTVEQVTIGNAITDNADLTPENLHDNITQSPYGWTNGNVKLTLALTNTGELDDNPYSWDNGNTWSTSRDAIVSENGFYTVEVKDRYGNIITSDLYHVENIDKLTPSITSTPNEAKNKITLAVEDDYSGLQKVTVTTPVAGEVAIAEYSGAGTGPILTDSVEYSVPMNGTYVFKVYDNAGNVETATETIDEAKTDNTELNTTTITSRIIVSPTAWTNGSVKIKLALDSMEGLAGAPYKWSTQDAYSTENEITVTENGTYSVTVKDMYGNEFTSSGVVIDNIDIVEPTLSFNVNERSNKVIISATDAKSLMQKITITGGTHYSAETTVKDAVGSLDVPTLALEWTIPESDTTYTIKAYDNAGNVKTETVTVETATTDNDDLTPENLHANITQSPTGWTNTDVTLTLALTNTGDMDDNPYSWDDGATWSTSRNSIVEGNGTYIVKVKDMYGNVITSDPYTVNNIDKVAPTASVDYKDATTKNTAVFTLTDTPPEGETAVSGVDKLTLCTEENGSVDETVVYDVIEAGVGEVTAEWAIPQKGTYTFKVYDNAGSVTTYNLTFDEAIASNEELDAQVLASRISLQPSTYTSGEVKLQLTLNDTSGLADKPFKWVSLESYGLPGTTIDPETGVETPVDNRTFEYLTEFTNQNYVNVAKNGEYFVIIKDKYGNEFESDYVSVSNIDTYSPRLYQGIRPEHNISNGATDDVTVSENGTVTLPLCDSPVFFGLIPEDLPVDHKSAHSGITKVTIEGGAYATETVIKDLPNHPVSVTVSHRVPTLGDYTFRVYDAVGNVTEKVISVTSAKTDNAEINDPAALKEKISSNAENAEWVTPPVRLAVDLSSMEGLAENPFKWSTQDDYSNVNYIDVYENGEYTVTIKDIYGNENVSDPFVVSNIDSGQPTLTLSKSADGTKLIYSTSDTQSGISRIEWSGGALEALTPIQTLASPQGSLEGSVPFPNNGTYTVTVYDKCGNSASADINVENITAPNPLLDEEGEGVTASIHKAPTSWTNMDVTVSIDMPNKVGVSPNGYLWTSTAPVTDETRPYLGVKGNRTSIVVTENGTAQVVVTDDYGKEFTSDVITIDNIDKVPSVIEASLNDNNNKILIHATDELSGIASLTYAFADIGSETTELSDERTICSLSSHTLEVNREIKVEGNGLYRLFAYDNAGNVSNIDVLVENAATDKIDDNYVTSHIEFGTSGYTNENVTITVNIPDKDLLAENPYSWDGGETWSNENSYEATDNGTYEVLVKDKYGNVYTGTAIVANIDRVDPTVSLFQNGNKLVITVGDNTKIDKVTMFRPDDRYEETLKSYEKKSIYDKITIELDKNGTYTVCVYDTAGNVNQREIGIEGITEKKGSAGESGSNGPILDVISQYTDGQSDTDSGDSSNSKSSNTSKSNSSKSSTTSSSKSGNSNVTKEYHYDTKTTEKSITIEKPVTSNTTSGSAGYSSYTMPITTAKTANTSTVNPTASSPAVKITPSTTTTTTSNTKTTATAPATATTTTSNTKTTASTPTSTTANTSAQKVTPSSTTTTTTTTSVVAAKPTETGAEKEEKADEKKTNTADEDAKAMYRNNRVEQAIEDANKKDPKVGMIIMASVLGVTLIGVGIYAFTKRKEQKIKIED